MSTTPEPADEPSYQLEPVPTVLSGMPEPGQFKDTLLLAINTGYAELVDARGEVVSREDTFDVQRRLANSLEKCSAFAAAFTAATKLLKQYVEEELVLAVGEQDGIPVGPLKVPDALGDVSISLDQTHTYDIDVETLFSAVAATVSTPGVENAGHDLAETVTAIVEGDHARGPADLPDVLAQAMIDAQRKLTTCGKFTPQVSKVRAYAAEIARQGSDPLAAVVSAAITKTTEHKGVKITRKGTKP
jgi:hypothetical protein